MDFSSVPESPLLPGDGNGRHSTTPSPCRYARPPRHGKSASVDLDEHFHECIDRSDDSFTREFQEGFRRAEEELQQAIPRASEGLPRVEEALDEGGRKGSGGGADLANGLQPAGPSSTEPVAGELEGSASVGSSAAPSPSFATHPKVWPGMDVPEDVPQAQVEQVRATLPEEARDEPDDAMIRRFIRATGGNLTLSIQRLNTTLKWRAKVQPESVVCMACAQKPKSHYMHLVGYDYFNRPIIYSCLACATNKVYLDNYHHMIQTFEMAIKCMPPGVSQWVWVCDFHGFGMADINPKLAKAFLDISAEHYPERLGLFMVVGAPSLFNVLWKAIEMFVDPKTHQKIRFLPCDVDEKKSKLAKEMKLHFPPEVLDWVSTEMLQNREKKQASSKVYNMSAIYKQAVAGELQASAQAMGGKHDLRGAPNLLAAFAADPMLMEPQATADAYV